MRAASRIPARPPTSATVLLVDDDSAVRTSLQRALALEGWRIMVATDGENALEQLVTLQPDLLITDLCMAAVSGWDILFHENLQRPTLPIFVISALPPSAFAGADHFATAFFQKPLDLDALVAAIHRQLKTSVAHPAK
jgi:DNA-binding NtrC family response regulator